MQKPAIEYFRATAQRFPDNVAIVDGEKELRFGELWERGRTLADGILSAGADENLPIIVHIPKSMEAVVAIVAIQLSGNTYVPMDTNSPVERKKNMLLVLGPHAALSWSDDAFVLDGQRLSTSETAGSGQLSTAIAGAMQKRKNTDPLYIIFTSGTTGTPKA